MLVYCCFRFEVVTHHKRYKKPYGFYIRWKFMYLDFQNELSLTLDSCYILPVAKEKMSNLLFHDFENSPFTKMKLETS